MSRDNVLERVLTSNAPLQKDVDKALTVVLFSVSSVISKCYWFSRIKGLRTKARRCIMGILSILRFAIMHGPSIKLNIVVYKEGEEWVAHCLQMDVVATNTTRDAVEKDILDLIKAQVTFAIENDNMGALFMPAPPEEWKRLELAVSCERKTIDIFASNTPSRPAHSKVREVEFCLA